MADGNMKMPREIQWARSYCSCRSFD